MPNKRKTTTAIVAGVTAAALLLGGTFAWQSINQTALNEASDVINPGGRLHDDFNGSNKDVYVENFADEDIFARIQLSEYFAIIANYDPENPDAAQTVRNEIIGTLNEDGTYSYETYKFDNNLNEDGTFKAAVDADGNPYWNWATGGSTVFMPTFNLNKDSLVADVNGTYQGNDGDVTDDATDDRYTDYYEYSDGETKTDDAIYDADTNVTDEVEDDFDNLSTYIDAGNVKTVFEEHTAKETGTGTLISMADWLAMVNDAGGYDADLHGNYWVYDTDGWVYWSAPIASGEATGLLLNGIELNGVMDDTWYYAINVVAQFVTADDVGQNDGTGFYDTKNGTVPTADAASLLGMIGVDMTEVIKLNGEQTSVVNPQNTYTMSVGVAARSASTYTFTLAEGAPAEITITDSTLNVGAAEEGTQFTVIATPDSGETVETTFTVSIKELLIANGGKEGEIDAAVGEPIRPVPYNEKVDLSTIYVYYEVPNALTLKSVADTSYTYEDGILTITDSALAGYKLGVFDTRRTSGGWINLTAAATDEPTEPDTPTAPEGTTFTLSNDLSVPAYAILTNADSEGMYEMTMLRTPDKLTANSADCLYGGEQLVAVYEVDVANPYATSSYRAAPWDSYSEQISSVQVACLIKPVYTNCWFANFRNCTSFDLALLDTSETKSVFGMFWYCSAVQSLDLSNFDTSNVENMDSFLYCCSALTDIKGLEKLDTSKVTIMRWMMSSTPVTELDLSGWDVSNVTSLWQAFDSCLQLTSLNVTGWNLESMDLLYRAFNNCVSLKQMNGAEAWDTSKVTDMEATFNGCSVLELDCSGWTVSQITTAANYRNFNTDAPYVKAPAFGTAE